MKQVTMPYAEYRAKYHEYQTVLGSYDARNETIKVELPDDVEFTPIESTENEWLSVEVNPDNIKCWSNTSVCIKLPYQSEYRNCEMWVPRNLIKKNEGMYTITFKEDFSFRIRKRSGNEIEMLAGDLVEVFKSEQEYPEIHIPEILEPIEPKVLEELIDAD